MQNATVPGRKRPVSVIPPFPGSAMRSAIQSRSRAASLLLMAAWCLLPLAFFLAPARADIQLPPKANSKGERQLHKRIPPPPSPVATKVRLQPGGSAEIVLQANGALGKMISFLLRTPPAHGSFVGTPRRIGRDSVAVTYVHRATDGPGHDTFTFAAQAPGTAVSAAETVDIEVADAAPDAGPAPAGLPDLAASPSELDFGAVEAGNSTGVTLTLENRGGGLANGRLDPPPPWTVEGEPSYSLGRGARQTFRFVFRPHAEGSFAETLRVDTGNADSTTGCVVRLVGTGLAAPVREPLPLPAPAVTPAPTPVQVANVLPTPTPAAAPSPERPDAPPVHSTPGTADSDLVFVNMARVTAVNVLAVGTSTLELGWSPPAPLPRGYRIERRSFARDEREPGNVRTDWLPYDRTDFRVRADRVTATLRGLTAGEPVTVRVLSVDAAGQLSQPSPLVDAVTLPASGWWRPTPLKVLLLLLAGCVALIVRHRWQERQLLRALDARHLENQSSGVARPDSFHPL